MGRPGGRWVGRDPLAASLFDASASAPTLKSQCFDGMDHGLHECPADGRIAPAFVGLRGGASRWTSIRYSLSTATPHERHRLPSTSSSRRILPPESSPPGHP